MTDLTNAYYEAKKTSDKPTTQDLMEQYQASQKGDSFEEEQKILESRKMEKTEEIKQKNEIDYHRKYVELLEKYVDLLEKYNDLKQDN